MIKIDKIKLQQAGLLIAALTVMFIILNTISGSQWMLFYDKSFSGTVIDAETNQPIEGAIVVGMWRLSQFPSEGFGGYAKVGLVTSDKEGKFTIPWWITFKPWKFYMYLQSLAPEIYVYKPGYRFHWTDRLSRAGYPGSYEKTTEERMWLKEQHSIDPAMLYKVHKADERIQNYHDWGMTRFPGGEFPFNHYSRRQIRIIYKALEEEFSNLPKEIANKYYLGH